MEDKEPKKKDQEEENIPKENGAENIDSEREGEEEDCCGEEIQQLEQRLMQMEQEIDNIKKSHEKQLLEFIEKKTKEATKIISDKEKELSEKYKKEFENSRKYLYERQLSDLSQIVSQFENVMNSITNPEVSNYLAGFRMFLSKFSELFSELGIAEIEPKEGDEFNSEIMEATSVVSTEDPEAHNRITKVFSKGYRLHERMIKLASVEVTKFEK